MAAHFPYDVFLSHNAKDKPRVLLLCISPNALASKWVALERSTAIHRDPANESRCCWPTAICRTRCGAIEKRARFCERRLFVRLVA